MQAFGLIVFLLGAAGLDSESIVLPAVMMLIGASLVLLSEVARAVRRW